jgi:hypothetical protein
MGANETVGTGNEHGAVFEPGFEVHLLT